MNRKEKAKPKGVSQRQLRVGELFRQRLCEVFVRDDVRGADINTRLVTVTEVTTSPDLRNATAYIMPLGGSDVARFVTSLNQLAPQLRAEMSKGLRLKYVPQLTFKADRSFENADQMRALLSRDEVVRDLDDTDNQDGTNQDGTNQDGTENGPS